MGEHPREGEAGLRRQAVVVLPTGEARLAPGEDPRSKVSGQRGRCRVKANGKGAM